MATNLNLGDDNPNHQRIFDHLPQYEAPSTGLLTYVPNQLLPYAELARIDKPGLAPLWIVHSLGILQAGIILQAPPSVVFRLIAFFLPACEVLMCVNFAWNDTCDSEYDAKVARSRHRPLVRGAVTISAAIAFDLLLAVVMASFLVPLPWPCTMYAIPMALGCFIYPLSKRWTNYPQFVLGIVLASGVFLGAAAVGATPLPYPNRLADLLDVQTWTIPQSQHFNAIIWCYITNVIWTVFFEIIYSFQDVQWDEGAKVGTITIMLQRRGLAKGTLSLLAILQTCLHAQSGRVIDSQSIWWPVSVALMLATLTAAVIYVRLDSQESCMFWFGMGNIMTGLAMLIGYVGEYTSQALF